MRNVYVVGSGLTSSCQPVATAALVASSEKRILAALVALYHDNTTSLVLVIVLTLLLVPASCEGSLESIAERGGTLYGKRVMAFYLDLLFVCTIL
jgi:hypothetical protein